VTAFTWNVPFSGNWSTVADWAPLGAGPPRTAFDSASFSPSGHAVVTLDVNETIGALTVLGSANTLAIGSNQLTVTNADGLAGTVTVISGGITIAGGTLSATNGISVQGGRSLGAPVR
jgi:phage baseplate assembly protein gpV